MRLPIAPLAVAALATIVLAGCASSNSPTTEPATMPYAANYNEQPTVLPYNGGVYDMNGPYQNAGNNDLPNNSK